MLVIALQFGWAAITAYCMHESGKASVHFGHHEHLDGTDELVVSSTDQGGTVKKTVGHVHCSIFSYGALSPDFGVATVMHPLLGCGAPSTTVVSLSSSYTIPPERPQWPTAA